MKRAVYTSIFLLLFAAVPARAQQGRGYVGGQLGMFLPIKSDVTGNFPENSGTLTYDPGLAVAATGGYQFVNGLRGEGELSFRHNTTDKLTTSSGRVPVHGDATCYGLMTNLYYDIRTPTAVTVYIGAGAGVVGARFGKGSSNGNVLWNAGNEVSLAYQAIGGLATRLSDSTSLDFVYRHYASPRLHFQPLSVEFRGPTLSVGIRHWF